MPRAVEGEGGKTMVLALLVSTALGVPCGTCSMATAPKPELHSPIPSADLAAALPKDPPGLVRQHWYVAPLRPNTVSNASATYVNAGSERIHVTVSDACRFEACDAATASPASGLGPSTRYRDTTVAGHPAVLLLEPSAPMTFELSVVVSGRCWLTVRSDAAAPPDEAAIAALIDLDHLERICAAR